MGLRTSLQCSSVFVTLLLAGCASTGSNEDLAALAQRIHADALVLDAHADIEIPGKPTRYAGPDGVSRVSPDKMAQGGVDIVVVAAGVGPGGRDDAAVREARALADAEVASVHATTRDSASGVVLVRSADEIVAAHEANQRGWLLGFQNARSLGNDASGIDQFYAAGVRVFALTHMGHNNFADSSRPVYIGETKSYEPTAEHGGLSPLGRDAIRRINRLGGVVDVSQLSRDATLQAIELSATPVIASHSNVKTLSNVQRNLSDEEIDRVGETGGVVHIAAFRGYLFDSNDDALNRRIVEARREAGLPDKYDYPYELYWELPTMEAQLKYTGAISDILGPGSVRVLVDHIDYVVQRIGVDHVGIGNDFNHGGGIEGYTDASGALIVTEELLRRGYSEADIRKIWGENFLRVLRAAEDARG